MRLHAARGGSLNSIFLKIFPSWLLLLLLKHVISTQVWLSKISFLWDLMSQLDGVATVVALFDYYCSRTGNRGDAPLICPSFSFSFHYINPVKLISGRIIWQLIILPYLQSHPHAYLSYHHPKSWQGSSHPFLKGREKNPCHFIPHTGHILLKNARHFLWIIILNNRPAFTMIFSCCQIFYIGKFMFEPSLLRP